MRTAFLGAVLYFLQNFSEYFSLISEKRSESLRLIAENDMIIMYQIVMKNLKLNL